ncbi:hypothetical protein WME75_16415 [Sorangium sp. So ce1014]|uniref:hypothetical protein n=1 Tax=Sorangium sp. So ce1014 TaxID=3133326 RepID=UPI003F5DEF72
MAADPESKHPTSPVLARWRETASRPGALPRGPRPRVQAPRELPAAPPADPVDVEGRAAPGEAAPRDLAVVAPSEAAPRDLAVVAPSEAAPRDLAVVAPSEAAPRDPVALLAEIEEAIAAAAPPAFVAVARAALDPLRAALGAPGAERDPAALLPAFEQAEDILEALLLLPARPPPPVES